MKSSFKVYQDYTVVGGITVLTGVRDSEKNYPEDGGTRFV